MHNTPDVAAANRKTDTVLEYNEANDGVDAMDKIANVFICKRKTKRWAPAIFLNTH